MTKKKKQKLNCFFYKSDFQWSMHKYVLPWTGERQRAAPSRAEGEVGLSSARRAGCLISFIKNRAASQFAAAHLPDSPEITPEIPEIPDSKAAEKISQYKTADCSIGGFYFQIISLPEPGFH